MVHCSELIKKEIAVNFSLSPIGINYVNSIIKQIENELCSYEYSTEMLFDLIENSLSLRLKNHLSLNNQTQPSQNLKLSSTLTFLLDEYEPHEKLVIFEFGADMYNYSFKYI